MVNKKATAGIALSALSIVIILVLKFGLPSASTDYLVTSKTPNVYNSTDYNFSIQYPTGWIVDDRLDKLSPTSLLIVSFSDPDHEAILGVGKANAIANRSNGIVGSAEDYAEITKASLRQTYGHNFVLTNEGRLLVNNVKGYFIEYARPDDLTKNKMVFLMNGDNAYLVVYNVDVDKYGKYAPQFEESLSTFKFLSKWVTYTNAG